MLPLRTFPGVVAKERVCPLSYGAWLSTLLCIVTMLSLKPSLPLHNISSCSNTLKPPQLHKQFPNMRARHIQCVRPQATFFILCADYCDCREGKTPAGKIKTRVHNTIFQLIMYRA